MADIRRLDGTAVDTTKPARNERTAKILERLTEENNNGLLTAFVSVSITPEAEHEVCWALPDHDYGYPWGLVLREALAAAFYRLGAAEIVVKSKPEEPDGA